MLGFAEQLVALDDLLLVPAVPAPPKAMRTRCARSGIHSAAYGGAGCGGPGLRGAARCRSRQAGLPLRQSSQGKKLYQLRQVARVRSLHCGGPTSAT